MPVIDRNRETGKWRDGETGRENAAARFSPLLAFLFFAVVLGGCEDTVNPILESDRDFTLFGTLDMARDTQFVRVIPIRATLLSGDDNTLDVTFTSTDLDEGETIVWRDSLITFANGAQGHVFYAPLRIRPGHSYRIAVQPAGSDLITSAITTVPEAPVPVVG